MKYFKYILFGSGAMLILTIFIIRLYFQYDTPNYSGLEPVRGLQDSVSIFKDSFGVPHIFAESDEDLFYSFGYIVARERLFQLSFYAAITRGEISGLLGAKYDQLDKYIKNSNLFNVSIDSTALVNKTLLQSYCNGINAWIDQSENNLPISFKILRSKPLKWYINDIYRVAAMLTMNYPTNRQIDTIINTIEQYFGKDKLSEIIRSDLLNQYVLKQDSVTYSLLSGNLTFENQILDLIGARNIQTTKYTNIIFEEDSSSSLIFKDTWGIKQPAKWFDVHLVSENIKTEGAVIPGSPMLLVGKTDQRAWTIQESFNEKTINNLFNLIRNKSIGNDTTLFVLDTIRSGDEFFDDKIIMDPISQELFQNINAVKREIANQVANIYKKVNSTNYKIINKLHLWNGDESEISYELLFVNEVISILANKILSDEFALVDEQFFTLYAQFRPLVEQNILKILNNSDCSWIDDISTQDHQETLQEFVVFSIDEAMRRIKNKSEYQILNGYPEQSEEANYQHILSEKSPLTRFFNFDIYDNDLNFIDMNIAQSSIIRIFDLSDINTSYSIIPTGQSGLPKSRHYKDQLELYQNSKFRTIDFYPENFYEKSEYQKLILYPAE